MTTKLSFCVELNHDGYCELKAYDSNGCDIPARKLADFDFEKVNAAISNHDRLVEENKLLREFIVSVGECDTIQSDYRPFVYVRLTNEAKQLLSKLDGKE